MLVTFSVLKFDKSSDVKLKQWENILFIVITFSVLKFSKFKEVNLLHP